MRERRERHERAMWGADQPGVAEDSSGSNKHPLNSTRAREADFRFTPWLRSRSDIIPALFIGRGNAVRVSFSLSLSLSLQTGERSRDRAEQTVRPLVDA